VIKHINASRSFSANQTIGKASNVVLVGIGLSPSTHGMAGIGPALQHFQLRHNAATLIGIDSIRPNPVT